MKLTKTAAANLKTIWTAKTAYGVQGPTGRYRITAADAKGAGYGWMNRNSSYSLVSKGLARTLVTKDEISGMRVLVLVLTDAGRAAIGV